jgi:Superfamily II DNA/RNA helicases, SNF2 family
LEKLPPLKRQEYVDLFQNNRDTRIIIGNIQSLGTGWTLTSAYNVVYVESSWIPGENWQCADRAHRIGQNFKVMLHFLVVEGSLDARILSSAALKSQDITKILKGD